MKKEREIKFHTRRIQTTPLPSSFIRFSFSTRRIALWAVFIVLRSHSSGSSQRMSRRWPLPISRGMFTARTLPSGIWKSEIFGRSLDAIVQEGIQSKIAMMPENVRYKLQQTLSKIVNKGSNTLIAVVI